MRYPHSLTVCCFLCCRPIDVYVIYEVDQRVKEFRLWRIRNLSQSFVFLVCAIPVYLNDHTVISFKEFPVPANVQFENNSWLDQYHIDQI